MHRPNIQTKITLLVVSVVFISISIIFVFISQWTISNVEDRVRINITNVARIVAQSPDIRDALITKDPHREIQSHIEKLLPTLDQIEFITVADMEGIRYSHPNPSRIGRKFVGGDDIRVRKTGETYISQGLGTLGTSLRAFTPIYHPQDNKNQIGFVAVGTLQKYIVQVEYKAILRLFLVAFLALTIGGVSAHFLARNIKNTLFGFEPEEIAKMYNEKASMLEALTEGIVAINEKNKITLINESALKILQIRRQESELIGQDINEVIPASRLPAVMQSGLPEYNREIRIHNTYVMTNRVPIRNKENIIGAISTFQDKTKITLLAEEITGVKQIVEALRANTHEFMNKLHVILGLIELGELEEAKKYITGVTERQQQILSMVVSKIKDPTIAGLILGKFNRAKELDINIKIDESTHLREVHENIESSRLVTIIGNLVENAMEAVSKSRSEAKNVHIRLEEFEDRIEIEVRDSGIGIANENIPKIFERGYSTKEGSEGVGLALTKEVVKKLNGQIKVCSQINEGTIFKVIIPKEKLL